MTKPKKKPSLEDYVIFNDSVYKVAANMIGSSAAVKDITDMFFDQVYQFDKANLHTYTADVWCHLYYIYIMGVRTGEKNSEAIRGFTILSDAKKPIRLQ